MLGGAGRREHGKDGGGRGRTGEKADVYDGKEMKKWVRKVNVTGKEMEIERECTKEKEKKRRQNKTNVRERERKRKK